MSVVSASASQVPALAYTPSIADGIDADDLQISKVKIGQYMSKAFTNEFVKGGDIFTTATEDGSDAEVLWKFGSKSAGVQFHVLSLRKGKSLQEDGKLLLFDFNDVDAPPKARTTYNFTIAIPSVDEDLPLRWLFTGSGSGAARKIVTMLIKNSISGPSYQTAFEITTSATENDKGKFFVPQVKVVTPTAENVAIAAAINDTFGGQSEPVAAPRSNQPAI